MKLSNKIFLGIGFFDRTNNVLTDNVIHRPLTSYEHFQLQLRRKNIACYKNELVWE